MKIEEIPNKSKNEKFKKYWFPLSIGYNRLLIVVGIIVMAFIINENERHIDDFEDFISYIVVIFYIEVIIYLAAIWVYRGFKDLRDKQS